MNMIAKFKVIKVNAIPAPPDCKDEPPIGKQELEFMAVTDSPFNPNGESDDNSFARWTPIGKLTMTITNPALFGQFTEGEKYYLTFTEAEA